MENELSDDYVARGPDGKLYSSIQAAIKGSSPSDLNATFSNDVVLLTDLNIKELVVNSSNKLIGLDLNGHTITVEKSIRFVEDSDDFDDILCDGYICNRANVIMRIRNRNNTR